MNIPCALPVAAAGKPADPTSALVTDAGATGLFALLLPAQPAPEATAVPGKSILEDADPLPETDLDPTLPGQTNLAALLFAFQSMPNATPVPVTPAAPTDAAPQGETSRIVAPKIAPATAPVLPVLTSSTTATTAPARPIPTPTPAIASISVAPETAPATPQDTPLSARPANPAVPEKSGAISPELPAAKTSTNAIASTPRAIDSQNCIPAGNADVSLLPGPLAVPEASDGTSGAKREVAMTDTLAMNKSFPREGSAARTIAPGLAALALGNPIPLQTGIAVPLFANSPAKPAPVLSLSGVTSNSGNFTALPESPEVKITAPNPAPAVITIPAAEASPAAPQVTVQEPPARSEQPTATALPVVIDAKIASPAAELTIDQSIEIPTQTSSETTSANPDSSSLEFAIPSPAAPTSKAQTAPPSITPTPAAPTPAPIATAPISAATTPLPPDLAPTPTAQTTRASIAPMSAKPTPIVQTTTAQAPAAPLSAALAQIAPASAPTPTAPASTAPISAAPTLTAPDSAPTPTTQSSPTPLTSTTPAPADSTPTAQSTSAPTLIVPAAQAPTSATPKVSRVVPVQEPEEVTPANSAAEPVTTPVHRQDAGAAIFARALAEAPIPATPSAQAEVTPAIVTSEPAPTLPVDDKTSPVPEKSNLPQDLSPKSDAQMVTVPAVITPEPVAHTTLPSDRTNVAINPQLATSIAVLASNQTQRTEQTIPVNLKGKTIASVKTRISVTQAPAAPEATPIHTGTTVPQTSRPVSNLPVKPIEDTTTKSLDNRPANLSKEAQDNSQGGLEDSSASGPTFSLASPTRGLSASESSSVAAAPKSMTPAAVIDELGTSLDRIQQHGPGRLDLSLSLEGGGHVNIELQMRDGAIHASFQTTSPELRDALTQSWSHLANQTESHGMLLADPVFKAPATGSLNAGQQDFRERQQETPREPSFTSAFERAPQSPKRAPQTTVPARATKSGLNAWA